jgi:hypothetical protein
LSQWYAGECAGLAVQVRLVRVPGAGGYLNNWDAVAQQPHRAPEPQNAPQRRRAVAIDSRAVAL